MCDAPAGKADGERVRAHVSRLKVIVPLRQVADFFARLVQRVAPKHYAQAMAEVTVTRLFLENFSGDQVCAAAGVTFAGCLPSSTRPRDVTC